jgi:hypothetical protein
MGFLQRSQTAALVPYPFSKRPVYFLPNSLPLLALELVLSDSERHLQQLLLLLLVCVLQASCHRGRGVTTSIHDVLAIVVLGLVQQSLDSRLCEAPGSGVKRLFLGPDNSLGIGIHVEVLLELLPREGVQLLDTSQCHVVNLVVFAVLVQAGPNLTGAKNDSINLFRSLDSSSLVLRIGDNPLESSVGASEFLNI